MEIERYGWSQCVSLAEMHRLICNMTDLGQHVTSCDLDLKSNFGIMFLGQHTYFEVCRREEHNVFQITLLAFLFHK